jgi:integrase
VLGTPKSHLARTVPLPRFLAAELADFTQARKPDDLVFTTAAGTMLRLSNWRRAVFLPARGRSGITDRFRIHDLRYTATALMISTTPRPMPRVRPKQDQKTKKTGPDEIMTGPSTWEIGGALGGTRTPNLLIRSYWQTHSD